MVNSMTMPSRVPFTVARAVVSVWRSSPTTALSAGVSAFRNARRSAPFGP